MLVKGADKKSRNAVMLPKQYGAGTITKKMLFPLSLVVTVSEFSSATMQSMDSNSVNPLKKELTKLVNGWGCAWIGAKIGASIGSGIPFAGTVIGGIAGSLVGGLFGY